MSNGIPHAQCRDMELSMLSYYPSPLRIWWYACDSLAMFGLGAPVVQWVFYC